MVNTTAQTFHSAVSRIPVLREFDIVDPSQISWSLPPAGFTLGLDQIHVWAAPLDLSPDDLDELASMLSAAERERAMRFRFDLHRNRFIAGRGLLRAALGQYLNTQPGRVEFVYGPNGKPSLSQTAAGTGIRFNLAHSEDLAVLAVMRDRDVGIDVERVRPIPEVEQLVARFFSVRENAAFQALPEEQRAVAFFNLWTRKEAWLKATGEGIARSLRRVEVSFLPGEPARLIHIEGSEEEAARWRLFAFKPAEDFVAALACQSCETEVNCWRWPGA